MMMSRGSCVVLDFLWLPEGSALDLDQEEPAPTMLWGREATLQERFNPMQRSAPRTHTQHENGTLFYFTYLFILF